MSEAETTSGKRIWSVVNAIGVKGALLLLIASTIALLFVRLDLLTQYRTDIAGAEFNVVYGVQKVMLGIPLYQDPEQPPFDIIQYTPLCYWLCGGVGRMLAIDPLDTYRVFLCSRILSLLLNVLTVWLVYRIARTAGAGLLAAWAALMVFAAFTQHFFARNDALYALFFIASLYAFVRWAGDPEARGRRLMWSAIWAVLCVMTKQTGVLIIGLIPAYLFLSRQWKPLRLFCSVVLAGIAVSAVIIHFTSSFDAFYKNTVQGLMNGTSNVMLRILFKPYRYVYYIGWHVATILLAIHFWRSGDRVRQFFALAMPVSLAYGLITATKRGSDLNYFVENLIFVFIALAIEFGSYTMKRSERPRPVMTLLTIAVLLYGVGFAVFQTRIHRGWALQHGSPESRYAAYVADYKVRDVLVNELGLRSKDKVFITYRGHLEHLLIGQGLLTQKDIIEWSEKPPFDYTLFDRAMTDGTVRYVIADGRVDTLQVMGHRYPQFQPIDEVGGRWILAPTRR